MSPLHTALTGEREPDALHAKGFPMSLGQFPRWVRDNKLNRFTIDTHVGANSDDDKFIWIAPFDVKVRSIKYLPAVAGTDAGAVSLDVRKINAASAPGAAAGANVIELLTTAFDLKAAANTTLVGALVTTEASLQILATNKIAMNSTGTTTAVKGILVIEMEMI